MLILKRNCTKFGGIFVALLACAFVVRDGIADDAPGITIAVANTNQLLITITNGVSLAHYEVYRRPLLDPLYPWTWHTNGVPGQTNFLVNMDIESTGFFQISVGSDWDNDGTPNWMDADPTNPAIGALSITIDTPAHGSTFN